MNGKIINVMDYEQWQEEYKKRRREELKESLKLFGILILFSVVIPAIGLITWLLQVFY